jgi:hypothetical protein
LEKTVKQGSVQENITKKRFKRAQMDDFFSKKRSVRGDGLSFFLKQFFLKTANSLNRHKYCASFFPSIHPHPNRRKSYAPHGTTGISWIAFPYHGAFL